MNIKIRVCQIIGPAAAGSARPVPTALSIAHKIALKELKLLRNKNAQKIFFHVPTSSPDCNRKHRYLFRRRPINSGVNSGVDPGAKGRSPHFSCKYFKYIRTCAA